MGSQEGDRPPPTPRRLARLIIRHNFGASNHIKINSGWDPTGELTDPLAGGVGDGGLAAPSPVTPPPASAIRVSSFSHLGLAITINP